MLTHKYMHQWVLRVIARRRWRNGYLQQLTRAALEGNWAKIKEYSDV